MYVATNGSDSNDGFSWDTPKLTIKNATGTVNANGTIHIANGEYKGENNTGITIDKNMTIIGESQTGTIINGTGTNWIFNIAHGNFNVKLQNLTLTAANGCAILNYANLTVENCTFTDNTAVNGGAICNTWDGACNVKGCTFTGNNASTGGGAIFHGGNGIFTITCCNFTNNSAQYGGAIDDGNKDLIVENCTFTSNTAEDGGAIIAWAGSTLDIFGCSFISNMANGDGGAINFNCHINITYCTFINNTANGNGGSIYSWTYKIMKINFNRFYNNTALNGNAIYADYSSPDAENNWWGSNNPNWSNLIYGFTPPTNWVILSVNVTPNSVNNCETSTITADFNHINGGGELTGGHIPDGPLTLNVPWGSFTSSGITHSVTLDTVEGLITAIFNANDGAAPSDPVKVTATADGYTTNDTESAYITINPAADISVNKTFEDTNHNHITSANYQDTIIIHLNVTNNGPDMAKWVAITDIIPADIIPVQLDDGYLDITSNNPGLGYVYYYDPQWLTIYIADIANGASYDVWIKVTNVGHNNNLITNTANLNTTETYPYDPNPDNDNSTDSFTANAAANVIIKTTSSKTNPKVGETFLLTYKLGNKGPDAAENVTITIPLPEGFVISQITGDGNWTYNSNTNTITWTMANVPVGDPYLYISGHVNNPGAYVFGSSISSETYNINTEGVTPITINAVAEVKAASKTIPLQKTGLPISGLILAILAVFGGLAGSKRK